MLHYTDTILYYTMLCYTILYYTILYYTLSYCTALYYTMLYYTITIPYYTILYYTILYYTILYYTILCAIMALTRSLGVEGRACSDLSIGLRSIINVLLVLYMLVTKLVRVGLQTGRRRSPNGSPDRSGIGRPTILRERLRIFTAMLTWKTATVSARPRLPKSYPATPPPRLPRRDRSARTYPARGPIQALPATVGC